MKPFNHFSLSGADASAEAIAARDGNNLYRTSCFFQDLERYRAFCAQYAVMRLVDDRIDELPSRAALSPAERRAEQEVVNVWQRLVTAAHYGKLTIAARHVTTLSDPHSGTLFPALAAAFRRFPVPLSLWDNFFAAMRRDLVGKRFTTYQEFLEYAEGATAAPTTIYLYLLAANPQPDGRYQPPPEFDLIRCGRALGLFAYLDHILRDLPEDLATGTEGLLYFAADDLRRHQLTEAMLFADLAAGCGRKSLRALVATLVARARAALAEGRNYLTALHEQLAPDCAFILNLIVAIYEAMLEKIEASGYDPMARRHHLTDAEKISIVQHLAGCQAFSASA